MGGVTLPCLPLSPCTRLRQHSCHHVARPPTVAAVSSTSSFSPPKELLLGRSRNITWQLLPSLGLSRLSSLSSSHDQLLLNHARGMASAESRNKGSRIHGSSGKTSPPSSDPPSSLESASTIVKKFPGIFTHLYYNSWQALPLPGIFRPWPWILLTPAEEYGEAGGGFYGWLQLSAWLFFFGFGLGAPLDGIHSAVGLQTYDIGAVTIGGEPYGLHTNIWVFPLLGIFYSILGVLQLILDCQLAKPGQLKLGSWESVLASVGTLIGLLRLSAQLYEDEMPYLSEFAILAVCAHVNWYIFDRTWWGYLLAAFVAVAAPASEIVVMRYFGLWHYSNPDLFLGEEGIVSWTAWCYFIYTQWVGTLARCLASFLLPKETMEKFLPQKSEENTRES